MPHIIIEHSVNAFSVGGDKVMRHLFNALTALDLFNLDNVKLRLHPQEQFYLQNNLQAFVHIQCRIHHGRSIEQKKQLSEAMVNSIKAFCIKNTVITCEVCDMDRESYTKQLS